MSISLMIVANLINYIIVKKYFKNQYGIYNEKSNSVFSELLTESKYVFPHKLSSSIVDGTDYITLSVFLGLRSVAY